MINSCGILLLDDIAYLLGRFLINDTMVRDEQIQNGHIFTINGTTR